MPYDLFTAVPEDCGRTETGTRMDLSPIALSAPPIATALAPARSDAEIREAARSFEAAFLAEMLRYTQLNANPAGFGGGAGEEAFGGLLTDEYARLLAERGGVGLAERIFDILKQGNAA